MTLIHATQIFAAIVFTVIGLSHIMQSRAWVEFFVWLRSKGDAGVLAIGLLSFHFGAFIAAFHNVWQGLPIVLTLFGWANLIKGGVYLIIPSVGMRGLNRVSLERSREFVAAGAFILGIGVLTSYIALFR